MGNCTKWKISLFQWIYIQKYISYYVHHLHWFTLKNYGKLHKMENLLISMDIYPKIYILLCPSFALVYFEKLWEIAQNGKSPYFNGYISKNIYLIMSILCIGLL